MSHTSIVLFGEQRRGLLAAPPLHVDMFEPGSHHTLHMIQQQAVPARACKTSAALPTLEGRSNACAAVCTCTCIGCTGSLVWRRAVATILITACCSMQPSCYSLCRLVTTAQPFFSHSIILLLPGVAAAWLQARCGVAGGVLMQATALW